MVRKIVDLYIKITKPQNNNSVTQFQLPLGLAQKLNVIC
jgi:hydroxymethylglutaryl-CoA reductase